MKVDDDKILKAIKMFENHPSIIKINKITTSEFSFNNVMTSQIYDEIIALSYSKACPKESIPPKVVKENHDTFTIKIHNDINYSTTYGEFPHMLKLADVTPIHTKDDRYDKSNYRLVSLLPAVSKNFERVLYK